MRTPSKHIIIAFTLAIIIGCLAVAGCAGQGVTSTGDGYELTNQRIDAEKGMLVGTVKNTCGRLESLMITWDLYDEDGVKTGFAFTSVEDIESGASAEFEAVLTPDDLSQIVGYSETVKSFSDPTVNFLKQYIKNKYGGQ